MKIINYINESFGGNQSEFARAMDVSPQQVTKWIKGDWIIVDGKLYSPRTFNRRLVCQVRFEHFAPISRDHLVEFLEQSLFSNDGEFVNEVYYSNFNTKDDLINHNCPYVVLCGSKKGIAFTLSKLASMAKVDQAEIKEKYHIFFENDESGI
ncbi:helix-turn-helix domain-containing protein [Pseudomonas lundensis]|uniref:helix-turn-helix domain-containing protein n=1 Tax=Serratia proteamaculans TaxID=28151 RepID=UPI0029811349|nr:helix-turn-helix domain-containing protein [Serratia proteamaculans]MDW5499747.1 helix-turn-helix domain-containing protein [Serratia proteamaculans]MDW5504812.1 helix-turn-helix domain-containing protein [Pseudomonas lundensis]